MIMTKTRTVYAVMHETETLEIVLDRRDQFDKWLTVHNINRLNENIDDHLKKYSTEAEMAYRNSHEKTEKAYAKYLIEKYQMDSELADELAEEIHINTEPSSEFTILPKELLTAIKL